MKSKLMLGLLSAAVLATNSFALEIHGGKLLKHKESSTGNIKFVLKDANPAFSKYEAQTFKNKKRLHEWQNTDESIYGNSYIGDEEGIVGDTLDVMGYDYIWVRNDTASTKKYTITTSMCVESSPVTPDQFIIYECGETTDEISLNPHGDFSLNKYPVISKTFTLAGEYYSYIATQIKVENQTSIGFVVSASSMIHISDNVAKK